jgi:hypothetical protein
MTLPTDRATENRRVEGGGGRDPLPTPAILRKIPVEIYINITEEGGFL